MTDPAAPPFLLRPWDRDGQGPATPPADALVEVDGTPYVLRLHNNTLFFRAAERNEQDWTYAIRARVPKGAVSDVAVLASFFEIQWRKRDFVRYALYDQRAYEYVEGMFLFFFERNGSGYCLEPWSDEAIDFTWHRDRRHVPSVLTESPEFFHQAADRVFKQTIQSYLHQRKVSETDLISQPLEFLCGSLDELVRLIQLICSTESNFFEVTDFVELRYTTESAYSRAGLCEIRMGSGGRLSIAREESGTVTMDIYGEVPTLSERFLTLNDLTLDYNTPIGFYWEYNDEFRGYRAGYDPYPRDLQISVNKPTAEEKLEAFRLLSEWLGDKVPKEELAELMPPDQGQVGPFVETPADAERP